MVDLIARLQALEEDVRYHVFAAPGEPEHRYVPGALPVLLSAPHGAAHTRNGQPKPADDYTAAFVQLLAAMTGAHALYLRRRSMTDANWQPGCRYKTHLAEIVAGAQIRFVMDIHGASRRWKFGMALGTMGGHTCPAERPAIVQLMAAHGFTVEGYDLQRLDLDARFTANGRHGQETVTRYAWEQLGVPAAQFEIDERLRVVAQRPGGSAKPAGAVDPAQVARAIAALAAVVQTVAGSTPGAQRAPGAMDD